MKDSCRIKLTPVVGLLCISMSTQAADTLHAEVKWAIAWQLPANTCKAPRLKGYDYNTLKAGGYFGGPQSQVANGDALFDLDYYEIKRFERKRKRWQVCIEEYKDTLREDFDRLMASAQYGLTQTQANAILGHMAYLQAVLRTEDALPVNNSEEERP